MKTTYAVAAALAAVAAFGAPAGSAGGGRNDWVKDGTNSTVITSKSLVYDPEKRQAVFQENVVVTDADVTITSDTLTVSFDDQSKVSTITAEGAVCIRQSDRTANARRAVYNVEKGEVVLTGNPQVQQGRDIMRGEIITFWPGSKRIRCEPNAVLVIHADDDTRRDTLNIKRD